MPEYLAPGVYIEETSFRNKTIEGVSTSTAGFVGPARFGPTSGLPELLTSFADFERIYGNIAPMRFDSGELPNFLAQGVRAFFDNGGKRLYVSRTYIPPTGGALAEGVDPGVAWADVLEADMLIPSSPPPGDARLVARYPGAGGNIQVTFIVRRGENVLVPDPSPQIVPPAPRRLKGVQPYDLLVVGEASRPIPGDEPVGNARLYFVRRRDGSDEWEFVDDAGTVLSSAARGALTDARVLTVSVEVRFPPAVSRPGTERIEVWENLGLHPLHDRGFDRYFGRTLATRALELAVPFFVVPGPSATAGVTPPLALMSLLAQQRTREPVPGADDTWRFVVSLANGRDGNRPLSPDYEGADTQPDRKTGLKAFEDLADVSIVAAPGSSSLGAGYTDTDAIATALELIEHCQKMRYRIAVLDTPAGQNLGAVRQYRAQFDSTHAALYYPWVTVVDPVTNRELNLPPSGFVAGIYARNDVEKGVHKAPANEVVLNAVRFETMLNKSQQDVLNPEGINCFRFFEGRGYRLWGARLATSDGEWRYVNLRRYFAYVERSVERGMQWVVFENNSELLWDNVRSTVEDFLFAEWKSGHLMGTKPEEAFFVRCDRSTMTQNDIDSGRLICLIGIAPMRPAEFVIFRIGQWTGSARR